MHGPWDAPLDLRRQLADEEDPVPPDFVEVPSRHLAPDYDPDELLGIVLAYAGQVMAADLCVGAFAQALETVAPAEETLFVLTSSKGFPLGEHLQVGDAGNALYHELLHVPVLARFPDQLGATWRSQTLWQPHHLRRSLLDWLAPDPDLPAAEYLTLQTMAQEDGETLSQRACTVSAHDSALRTPAWFLRVADTPRDANPTPCPNGPDPMGGVACELYVKPDDRWDINNVATRCPDCVRQMHQQLIMFQQAARHGRLHQLPALPEDLAERLAWRP
jgi:hypothetical protein